MDIVVFKSLLGILKEDISKDHILTFIATDVEETIKNYCNLTEIPIGLKNTAIRMAVDLYRNENLGEEDVPLGSISSITEGDTTVSYKSSASEFKNTLLKDYKQQLNRYRKLVW